MADSIILLEERKEVTTFLLDEGTITATTVTTPTGETPGYEYAGTKIKVELLYQTIQILENLLLKNTLQHKVKSF